MDRHAGAERGTAFFHLARLADRAAVALDHWLGSSWLRSFPLHGISIQPHTIEVNSRRMNVLGFFYAENSDDPANGRGSKGPDYSACRG
jgi:hypothetical protein